MYRYAGILSAYGMALADVVHEAQEPAAYVFSKGKKLKINFLLLSKVSILLVVTFFYRKLQFNQTANTLFEERLYRAINVAGISRVNHHHSMACFSIVTANRTIVCDSFQGPD